MRCYKGWRRGCSEFGYKGVHCGFEGLGGFDNASEAVCMRDGKGKSEREGGRG